MIRYSAVAKINTCVGLFRPETITSQAELGEEDGHRSTREFDVSAMM